VTADATKTSGSATAATDTGASAVSATGVPTRATQRDLVDTGARLQKWFRSNLPELREFELRNVSLPDGNGVANETLMCDGAWTDASGQHVRGFVVRIQTPEWLWKDVNFTSHRMMYQALADVPGVPVPAIVGWDDEGTVLGSPFFVMDRVEGKVPGDTPPFHSGGWVADLTDASREEMWRDAVAVMARLHQVSASKFSFLERPALGDTGFDQDLAYWRSYQQWALAGDHNDVIETAEQWLLDHLPEERITGIGWGDSRVGNMIFRDNRVQAVLDWDEVSLVGAESDLAWWGIMDFMNTESAGVKRLGGIGSPEQTVQLWEECMGRKAKDLWFHSVYAAYRMSIIMVRLGKLMGAAGLVPPEALEEMLHYNGGLLSVARMLDIPIKSPVTTAWSGLQL